ncbi:7,8-dihydropterin-6-methyl-4-(beta-D-ribofuranosyl)-aminobenzene-5'-phosphate synthase [Fusarium oxysporum f. sp. albedinis]|nr:7,8-dihydropterin-6-methyl-4-(beta-D-ribofuranosyl)-aminobenzene-5'-phosphate synthase [Fusarium oxysporum f. sp. albedinis]
MLFQWSEEAACRKIAGKIQHSTTAELALCRGRNIIHNFFFISSLFCSLNAESSCEIGAGTHGPLALDYLRPATSTLPTESQDSGADFHRVASVIVAPNHYATWQKIRLQLLL